MTHRSPQERALLAALRSASRGTLYRGKAAGTYFDQGRQVMDPDLLSGIAEAVDGGLLAFTARTFPTGVAVRADITAAGHRRLVELRQSHGR